MVRSAAAQLHEALDEFSCDHVVELCRQWDTDNSGTVNRREFAAALAKMGMKLTVGEISILFNKIDQDRSGKISYYELRQYLQAVRNAEHRERMDKWQADLHNTEIGARAQRYVM